MCTPGLRELKRRNPACHVTLYTHFQDLVAGLPFIDLVRPDAECPAGTIWLNYEKTIPPRRHLARIMGDHLGLAVRDVRPSCVIDAVERDRFRENWKNLPRPWVIIARRANQWTPNKDWPNGHWETLIDRLVSWCTIIEIGTGSFDRQPRPQPNYVDLVNRTTLTQLAAAIAAADRIIVPDSGPMHIAAAVGTPAVVIYGGYIDPVCTGYPGNVDLYSPVECAPCWLRSPCPYSKKCLHQITPDQVEAALNQGWSASQHRLPHVNGTVTMIRSVHRC